MFPWIPGRRRPPVLLSGSHDRSESPPPGVPFPSEEGVYLGPPTTDDHPRRLFPGLYRYLNEGEEGAGLLQRHRATVTADHSTPSTRSDTCTRRPPRKTTTHNNKIRAVTTPTTLTWVRLLTRSEKTLGRPPGLTQVQRDTTTLSTLSPTLRQECESLSDETRRTPSESSPGRGNGNEDTTRRRFYRRTIDLGTLGEVKSHPTKITDR